MKGPSRFRQTSDCQCSDSTVAGINAVWETQFISAQSTSGAETVGWLFLGWLFLGWLLFEFRPIHFAANRAHAARSKVNN